MRIFSRDRQKIEGFFRLSLCGPVLTPDKAALRTNIQRSSEREPTLPEEPMRNVDEEKHVQGLRHRAHLYAESIRQHEFIRQRMNINQQ